MPDTPLTIAFARRGYSASGGAEAYLKRLARGVVDAGHRVHLFTTRDWPPSQWPFGEITSLPADSPLAFANHLEQVRPRFTRHALMSLERVWQCDIFRAGDGVHRAWLERRGRFAHPLRRVTYAINPKHLATLRLEQALLGRRNATRVIVNSHLVRSEIVRIYDYPAANIDVVLNGVPFAEFQYDETRRVAARAALGLSAETIAVLFVGSGWERKGLRFAVDAVTAADVEHMRLLIAGRGDYGRFRSKATQFLGEISDVSASYAAADIFILPTIYDPFSNACLEALASGLPVITTRANGFAEVMRDAIDGTVVEAADEIAALASALRFWSDRQQRADTRAARLDLARRYDISINVERTLSLLLQTAASAASTSGKIRKT